MDGLDTKTDSTNTALTAEIDRAKAAELANGQLIAQNAAELANHATELADHETRISALEGDNTTNKQEIADLKAKNTQQDTAIAGNTDAIAHLTESLDGYVKTETYTAGQAAQDARITKLETDKLDKKATYTMAPVNVGYSENKVKLYYPGNIEPSQLEDINFSIGNTPYMSAYYPQFDGTMKNRWYHLNGDAVIDPASPYKLIVPCDTKNETGAEDYFPLAYVF